MFKRSRPSKRQTPSINAGKPEAQSKKIRLQALEPRVLLDAAAAATAATTAEQAQPEAVHAPDAANAELMQALERAHVAPIDAGDASRAAGPAAAPANVFFIDRSLPDLDTLVKDLGPNAEVHFIEPGQDGIKAIADVMQGRTDIASIQILSHGAEGELHLGSATLNAATMQGLYHDELAAIGRSLSANGDILIYGCDFGAGADGLQAMELLSDITGADVGASADITGAADLGGNWVLERQVGSVEADVVSAGDWHHDLALGAPSGQITNPGFTGTTGWTSDTGFASGSGWYLSGNTMLMYAENAKSSVTWNAPINGWNFGPGTNGAATVSVDFAFNNGDNPAVAATNAYTSCTFDIQVGGVTYARVTTPPGGASNEAGTATVTYLNGASGNVSTIAATPWGSWAYTTILVSLPKGIADGSQLRLVGNSTNAADDMTFDNVQVYTSPYINTTPVAVNDTVVTAEDTPVALNLLANDTDADGDTLKVYSLNNVTLTPGTAQSIAVPNGTVDVASNGAMTFRPTANYNGTSSFTYVAADPTGAKSTATVNLTITPVNDAPVLNPSVALTMPTVQEDAGAPVGAVGQYVYYFTSGAGNTTDVDTGAVSGVAIVGADNSHGTWYYSINAGSTWSVMGPVSDANALLLSHGSTYSMVYFKPNADWNGTGSNVVSHASDDNALHQQVEGSALHGRDAFDTQLRSIASLHIGTDVHLELVSRGQQTWLDVSDAGKGRGAIVSVSATLADGQALPGWIRVDGRGHITIERPVGADQLTLRITVTRKDGASRTHTVEVDTNANEMRQLGKSVDHKAAGKDKPAARAASLSLPRARTSRQLAPPRCPSPNRWPMQAAPRTRSMRP